MAKSKLRFGIGGLPLTNKGDILNGLQRLSELGLEHMEMEFVQSVYLKPEKAPAVRELAASLGLTLSVHGSYYINLASNEEDKWQAGVNRIIDAARVGDLAGAKSITYHSAFFQGQTFAEIKPIVIKGMLQVKTALEKLQAQIVIAPELTGKASQLGSLEELIEIVQAVRAQGFNNSSVCIDFAHNYARSGGSYNTYDEFMQMLDTTAKGLGTEALEHLHIHVSGITYGDKGEKHHLTYFPELDMYESAGVRVQGIEPVWEKLGSNRFEENKFDWQSLLRALHTAGVGGYVVCESPILELDALLMQAYYRSLS